MPKIQAGTMSWSRKTCFSLCFIFAGFLSANSQDSSQIMHYNTVMHKISMLLEEGHYSPRDLNDSFSVSVFKKFIEELDGDKDVFLLSDIQSFKKVENRIDDEMQGDGLSSFFVVNNVYKKRLNETADIYQKFLDKPFDFNGNETVEMNPDKLQFPANDKAKSEVWRKRMKYMVLAKFSDLQDDREKNKEKADFVVKADSTLEREARDQVRKQMARYFNTRKNRETDDENFSTFMNAITGMMDPHTNYFPPLDLRSFNESMSGRIYGIGAQIKEEDGKIKIGGLVTGGPAWKSGELQENDEILKVGQGDQEPVDVTGYGVPEAIKLIKGSEKGSIVTLTLRKVDGATKVISLVRDEIKLDETFVRSAIIKKGDRKIGFIYLPEFYVDFERFNGARCSVDMSKELEKLKAERVDGIVIDLRGNGGGSLPEVVQMVGLFIEEGPVCQVKGRYDMPSLLKDKDKTIQYTGPLAVMVDETSASASEIFAAAIQDYKRGVIIGSTSTYGKGTVQRNIPVANDLVQGAGGQSDDEMGSVKLTLQKFYRISGGSTQLKGVTPDIVIPDRLEFMKFREKDNPSALPWDEIPKADFKMWQRVGGNEEVVGAFRQPQTLNPVFSQIKNRVDWLDKNNDKEYALNLKAYKEEQKQFKSVLKEIDSLYKLAVAMNIENVSSDTAAVNATKEKSEKNRTWIKRVSEDVYVDQAVQIMDLMISKNNMAAKLN